MTIWRNITEYFIFRNMCLLNEMLTCTIAVYTSKKYFFFPKLNLPCTRTKYSLSSSPAGLDAKHVYLPVSPTWKHRDNFSRNLRLWEKFSKTKKYKHSNNIQQAALEHKHRRRRMSGKKVMKFLNTSLFYCDGVIQRGLRNCKTP